MTENLQAGRFDFNHIYKVVLDAGDLYELKENPGGQWVWSLPPPNFTPETLDLRKQIQNYPPNNHIFWYGLP